jgi:serine/threonine protein kinase
MIQREAAIRQELRHPLILKVRRSYSEVFGGSTTLVTEIAENGSLASHLPTARGTEMIQLQRETRMARVIVGIVLAMRYLHSQRIIHCNLTPDKILLDCDWNVRIDGFGHSISSAQPVIPVPNESNSYPWWPSGNFYYLAPECYDNQYSCESDVFSFGLILYELVAGKSAFPKHLNQLAVAKFLIVDNKRPTIPAFVLPAVQSLIRKCWKRDAGRRPTFNQVLDMLELMKFKLTANVNSSKLSEFVTRVKDWEETNAASTALID